MLSSGRFVEVDCDELFRDLGIIDLTEDLPQKLSSSSSAALEEEDEDKDGLYGGHDPGTRNGGTAFYAPKTNKMYMEVRDFKTWKGYEHEVEELGPQAVKVVKELREFFDQTKLFLIEVQNHPLANQEVKLFCQQYAQTVRALHPEILVRWEIPQKVKAYWGTRGREYKERKDNSLHTEMLSVEDKLRVPTIFHKPGHDNGYCIDGVEAALFAYYGYHYRKELMKPLPCKRGDPNPYGLLVMRTTIIPGDPLVEKRKMNTKETPPPTKRTKLSKEAAAERKEKQQKYNPYNKFQKYGGKKKKKKAGSANISTPKLGSKCKAK